MSPEFNRFKNVLAYIAENHSELGTEPIDFQCKIDDLKSTADNKNRHGTYHVVLYLFYGRGYDDEDNYDYYEFDIPAREKRMVDLEVGNLMSWLG